MCAFILTGPAGEFNIFAGLVYLMLGIGINVFAATRSVFTIVGDWLLNGDYL